MPLCSAHHAAVHEGRLVIRGTASSGFVFEHADGSAYGSPKAGGAAAGVLEQVFAALTAMGFKHKQAQAMIDAVLPRVGAEVDRAAALRMTLAAAPVVAESSRTAQRAVVWHQNPQHCARDDGLERPARASERLANALRWMAASER